MITGYDKEMDKRAEACVGKTITSVGVQDHVLVIGFDDETTLRASDEGQNCCEYRYMSSDDELDYYVGAKFFDIDVLDAPDLIDDEYTCHEQQFLHVKTSKGSFTVVNHNEHNGYYGGFWIKLNVV